MKLLANLLITYSLLFFSSAVWASINGTYTGNPGAQLTCAGGAGSGSFINFTDVIITVSDSAGPGQASVTITDDSGLNLSASGSLFESGGTFVFNVSGTLSVNLGDPNLDGTYSVSSFAFSATLNNSELSIPGISINGISAGTCTNISLITTTNPFILTLISGHLPCAGVQRQHRQRDT